MKMDQLFKDGQGDVFISLLEKSMGRGRPTTEERLKAANHVTAAIQSYMERPVKHARKQIQAYNKAIQAFIKTSDLAQPVNDIFDNFMDTQNYDMSWEAAFKEVASLIPAGVDFWEITTITEGSTWQLVPEGSKVKLQTVSGTSVTAYVHKYGDGFGWTDEMIRFRKLARMLELAEDVRNGYWRDKADRFYTMMAAALGGLDTFTTASTDLEADIALINAAAFNILNAVKDTRNLTDGTELLLYVSPQYKARILLALGELSQAFSGSTGRVVYNVRPVFTFNSNMPTAASGTFAGLLVIPGYKSQKADLMQPTTFMDNDILSLSTIQTWFAYYGGCVADTAQIRQLDFQ